MIIYFSATGNSEYIANAIADRLQDTLVCANDYIKREISGDFHDDSVFIFVFPVYLSTVPTVFRQFIQRSAFHGSRAAYFVPTCASADGSVPNAAADLCRETGYFTYMGSRKVPMPQNYITLFQPFDAERKQNCYDGSRAIVDEICKIIKEGRELTEKPASRFEYFGTTLVEKWYNHSFTKTKAFRVTDSCVGCGLCAGNCPSNAIELKDGKPVWSKPLCIHCMACLNRCPKQAIEYGKKTVGKDRHVCPKYRPDRDR